MSPRGPSEQTARVEKLMPGTDKTTSSDLNLVKSEEWPGIDSRFRLVILAALRSKQLLRGAQPRIEADPLRRRNARIALEELKRGLIPFATVNMDQNGNREGNGPKSEEK